MELINKTPLPAQLVVAQLAGRPERIGVLVAKATFRILADGRCEREVDEPCPIFVKDQETPLGLLPRDDFPRTDGADVIVLGNAHAPGRRAVPQMTVSIAVGTESRSLAVFGDRAWKDRSISPAQDFEVMPLTYAHAFGGTADIEIDKDSFVTTSDPRNPEGKGMDPSEAAKALGKALKVPPGYPKFSPERSLPNVEDPAHLVSAWEDSPDPACWATMPLSTSIHAQRAMRVDKDKLRDPKSPEKGVDVTAAVYFRAHPSLVFPTGFDLCQKIELTGMTPNGKLCFQPPPCRVSADFLVGERRAEKELRADTLVVLPEESRFYIVYRLMFNFPSEAKIQKSARLNVTNLA